MEFTNKKLEQLAKTAAEAIIETTEGYVVHGLYGVPRGGIPAAYLVSKYLPESHVVDAIEEATVIVDDLIDSGATQRWWKESFPELPFHALYTKVDGDGWIEFPWETTHDNQDTSGHDVATRLLQFVGEDPNRGGLLETPKRMMKAWRYWTQGYNQDPADVLKVFEDGAEKCDEMIVVKDIPIYSQCEHHLAPFFGVAHIGYIPDGKIVGLSKLSRIADVFARRLQVQERLTNQIADALEEHLNPLGVAVVIDCRHMCMESRGIQRQGASTVTSAMRGAMREDAKARAEFMGVIRG